MLGVDQKSNLRFELAHLQWASPAEHHSKFAGGYIDFGQHPCCIVERPYERLPQITFQYCLLLGTGIDQIMGRITP